jgi:hypothetical protein
LINEVRFGREDNTLRFKTKTPRHNELNFLPKRQYPKSPVIIKEKSPKMKKRNKTEEKTH